MGVLALNASGAHRAGRLLLIINANVCVFAGALLFTEPSGGILPFFAMAAIPLLLFGPDEWLLATLGAAAPRGAARRVQDGLRRASAGDSPEARAPLVLRRQRRHAFALAFLVPFFFFRSNLRAEASLAAAWARRSSNA